MTSGPGEHYTEPQQTIDGEDLAFLRAAGSQDAAELFERSGEHDAEETQAITMGVTRQAFRDATTLRASGRDFTPTTYGHLGRMQQTIARYRQRGIEPPAETHLFSSRIETPEPVRVEDIRGWARASVNGALHPSEVPYVPGVEEQPRSQVYRTSGRAAYDMRYGSSIEVPDMGDPIVDLTLNGDQEAAALRLIDAWKDHCDHAKDEAQMERSRRILLGSAALAGSLVVSSAAAWAFYEFFLSRQ